MMRYHHSVMELCACSFEHALLVGPHELALLGHVARPVHGVVQLDQLGILEPAVLVAGVGLGTWSSRPAG